MLVQTGEVGKTGFLAQPEEALQPLRLADLIVFGLILAFGALPFFFYERAADFLRDDVFFADAARSLIQHGFYGINGHPEINQPPGLSAILAMLCLAGGCSHAVFLRAMVVFETLGFLVCYELLRRHAPRVVAAAICLLLMSSTTYFTVATQVVAAWSPYFFATMCALLVARRVETAASRRTRVAWAALLSALCAASLMIASAAIALLGAMVVRIGIAFFRDRRLAGARLRAFLAALLLGVAVQGLWMHRQGAPLEWPIPGYPRPYLSQLMVKDGNHPELGMATLRDIPVRVAGNALHHSAMLVQLLLVQRSGPVAWMSVAIMGPLLLMLLGWLSSIWRTGGGLHDWYFAGYELIYLLWPWSLEARFFLPVAPLACLYLWRGAQALGFVARSKARLVGAVWLPASVMLTIGAWFWTEGSGIERDVSFLTWLLSAIAAAWMAWAGSAWLTPASPFLQWCSRANRALRIGRMHLSQLLVGAGVISLIMTGLSEQLAVGRDNVDLHSAVNVGPPDARAGMWIRSHTDTNAVVMARHVPTAYHYSGRNVVWFPPTSNSQLLMEGVQRLRVDYVIVVHRYYSYYLPEDDDCFAPLLAAHPDSFRLAFQTPEYRIFRVVRGT